MSTLATMLRRAKAIKRALLPRPAPVARILPSVFLTADGDDWPGCAEANAAARWWAAVRGVAVDEYAGIGPDEEGIDP